MSYWPGPAWHLWFIQTWFYILTWRFYTPCRARAVPVVRRAVSVWKPGRGGVAYISTRERASSGASAHTPHVEENILYWDYARAPPPPPPPPLGYMTRMRSHALKKNNPCRNRRTRHHNNMTQMHRALLNSLHVSARRKRGAATAAAEEAPPLPQKCLQLCCRRSGRVAAETTLIWPRP